MDLAERLKSIEKGFGRLREVAGIAPEEYFVYSKEGLVKGIEIEGKKVGNNYIALMEISLSPEESKSIENIVKGQSWADCAQVRDILGTTGKRIYVEGSFLLDFGGVNEDGETIVTLAYKVNHAFTNSIYLDDLGAMRIKLLEIINQPEPAVQETAQAEQPPVKHEQAQEPVQESQTEEAQPEAAQAEAQDEEAEKPEQEKSLADFLRGHIQDISDIIKAKGDSWEKFSSPIYIKSDDGNFDIRILGFEVEGTDKVEGTDDEKPVLLKQLGILIGSKPEKYQKQLEDALKQEALNDKSPWQQVGEREYVLGYLNVEFKELNGVPQIQASCTLESFTREDYAGIAETTMGFIRDELIKGPKGIEVPEMPEMETYEFPIKDKEVIVGGNFKGYLTAEEIEGELRVRLRIEYKPEDLTLDAIRSYAEKFGSKGYSVMPMDDKLSVRIGLEPGQTPKESYGKAMNVLSEATQIMTRPEESKTS